MNNGEERVVSVDFSGKDLASEAEDVPIIPENGALVDLPDRAKRQDDGSYILPLLYPVTLKYRNSAGDVMKEEVFDSMHLRRLNGADLKAVSAAGASSSQVAIARSARVNEGKFGKLFEMMDGEDIAAAGEIVNFFLTSGRKTGR
jgi:hypothetical protein